MNHNLLKFCQDWMKSQHLLVFIFNNYSIKKYSETLMNGSPTFSISIGEVP